MYHTCYLHQDTSVASWAARRRECTRARSHRCSERSQQAPHCKGCSWRAESQAADGAADKDHYIKNEIRYEKHIHIRLGLVVVGVFFVIVEFHLRGLLGCLVIVSCLVNVLLHLRLVGVLLFLGGAVVVSSIVVSVGVSALRRLLLLRGRVLASDLARHVF